MYKNLEYTFNILYPNRNFEQWLEEKNGGRKVKYQIMMLVGIYYKVES